MLTREDIDKMTYTDLLRIVRSTPSGEWPEGETGQYLWETYKEKHNALPQRQRTEASKFIGWDR